MASGLVLMGAILFSCPARGRAQATNGTGTDGAETSEAVIFGTLRFVSSFADSESVEGALKATLSSAFAVSEAQVYDLTMQSTPQSADSTTMTTMTFVSDTATMSVTDTTTATLTSDLGQTNTSDESGTTAAAEAMTSGAYGTAQATLTDTTATDTTLTSTVTTNTIDSAVSSTETATSETTTTFVSITSVTTRSEYLAPPGRRLVELTPVSTMSDFWWEVRYKVRVEESQAASKVAGFNATSTATRFASEMYQRDVADVRNVTFAQVAIEEDSSTTPASNSLNPDDLINQSLEAEREVVDEVLNGSTERAQKDIPGGTVVAQLVKVEDYPNVSITVSVAGTDAEVEVPLTAFEALGLGDPEYVVVVTVFDASQSAAVGGDAVDGGNSAQVKGAINLNLLSVTTGEYVMVQGLVDPIRVQIPVNRSTDGLRCAFWDEAASQWSTSGFVDGEQSPDGLLTCYTTHLTLFGAIIEGFVDTLVCSQATLLSVDSIAELGRGDWYMKLPAVLLWVTLACMLSLLAVAAWLDAHRTQKELWHDENFLIPEANPPSNPETPHSTEQSSVLVDGAGGDGEEEGSAEAGLKQEEEQGAELTRCGRACSIVWACVVLPAQCLCWCWGFDAVKDALDDLLENWIDNWGDIRTYLEGVLESISGGAAAEGGRFMAALSASMAAIMVRNAQLQAGAELGVAHDDVAFVMEDEVLQSMVRAESVQSMSVRGTSSYKTECTPHTPGTPGTRRRMKNMRGGSSHVLHVRIDADREVKRVLKLSQLHAAVGHQVNHHLPRHSKWKAMPAISAVLFMMQNPAGNMLLPSMFMSSAMRALLTIDKLLGALLVATVFFQAAGGARNKFSDPKCFEEVDGVGQRIGRLIAIGMMSALLAGLPVGILHSLHTRKFKRVHYVGCPEWHRQLRSWRIQDRLIWFFGMLYAASAVLFVSVFLANIDDDSLADWVVSSAVSFLQDWLIIPLILATVGPLLALVLLALVSRLKSSKKGEVIRNGILGQLANLWPSQLKSGSNDEIPPAVDLESHESARSLGGAKVGNALGVTSAAAVMLAAVRFQQGVEKGKVNEATSPSGFLRDVERDEPGVRSAHVGEECEQDPAAVDDYSAEFPVSGSPQAKARSVPAFKQIPNASFDAIRPRAPQMQPGPYECFSALRPASCCSSPTGYTGSESLAT